ncbi:Ca2+ regulator and membrane fusion protein Fig1-domain-containing protein [Xylaria digitata]|nr:Ca2+ regulator and membrane fusion protein Fig1-domain-containing protein [Xylaria digitata]
MSFDIEKYRFIPFLGFRHILIIFCLIPIISWSFLLAGCTASNGLRDVYILALSYNKSPTSTLPSPLQININTTQVLENQVLESHNIVREVRVGYLSICVVFNSGAWSCSTDPQELATSIRGEGNGDPLNLLSLADVVRTRTLFYALLIISLVFIFLTIFLLSTFPSWHEEEDSQGYIREISPFSSYKVLYITLGLSFVASLLGFASAFWQHIGAADASTLAGSLTYNMVVARVGITSSVLGWVAAAVATIVALGILLLIVSVRKLTQLAEGWVF